jgi:hypothetical protein
MEDSFTHTHTSLLGGSVILCPFITVATPFSAFHVSLIFDADEPPSPPFSQEMAVMHKRIVSAMLLTIVFIVSFYATPLPLRDSL